MLRDLIRRHPDVLTDMMNLTDDAPTRCKPHLLPYAMREEIRNEVDSMLEMGEVRPSMSPYKSPVVMVKKKMVLTGCMLTLGSETRKTEDLFRQLGGKKYLSKIDLTKGYCSKNVYNTATPDGQYEFLRMPF